MGQLNLSGALTAGPQGGGDVFPASQYIVPVAFREGSKQYTPGTGVLTQVLNSPSAFVRLEGVGPAAPVTQGSFLYLKTDSPIDVRITHDDGSGGQTVVIIPVHGLLMYELPTTKPLELLEAQGASKVEYLVVGPS